MQTFSQVELGHGTDSTARVRSAGRVIFRCVFPAPIWVTQTVKVLNGARPTALIKPFS